MTYSSKARISQSELWKIIYIWNILEYITYTVKPG